MIYSMVGGMIAVRNVTRPYQEITITFDALSMTLPSAPAPWYKK